MKEKIKYDENNSFHKELKPIIKKYSKIFGSKEWTSILLDPYYYTTVRQQLADEVDIVCKKHKKDIRDVYNIDWSIVDKEIDAGL